MRRPDWYTNFLIGLLGNLVALAIVYLAAALTLNTALARHHIAIAWSVVVIVLVFCAPLFWSTNFLVAFTVVEAGFVPAVAYTIVHYAHLTTIDGIGARRVLFVWLVPVIALVLLASLIFWDKALKATGKITRAQNDLGLSGFEWACLAVLLLALVIAFLAGTYTAQHYLRA